MSRIQRLTFRSFPHPQALEGMAKMPSWWMVVHIDGVTKIHGSVSPRHATVKTAMSIDNGVRWPTFDRNQTAHCISSTDDANCNGLTNGLIWTGSLIRFCIFISCLASLVLRRQSHRVPALLALIYCQLRLSVGCQNLADELHRPAAKLATKPC